MDHRGFAANDDELDPGVAQLRELRREISCAGMSPHRAPNQVLTLWGWTLGPPWSSARWRALVSLPMSPALQLAMPPASEASASARRSVEVARTTLRRSDGAAPISILHTRRGDM